MLQAVILRVGFKGSPQRLKPGFVFRRSGTSELVPFPFRDQVRVFPQAVEVVLFPVEVPGTEFCR
jgi:hypothetical protein